MNVINIDQIKRDISFFLERVQNGDSLVIVKDGTPFAELKPLSIESNFSSNFSVDSGKKRPFGLCVGEFTVPDDFDNPLPDSILNDFYNP